MSTFKRFEEIECWKLARNLSTDIYEVYNSGRMQNDYPLWNQINSSSGSIMDNIAEGYERDGKKEFIQFLSYAKGSCGELRSQLYRLLDRKYISEEEFGQFKLKTEECSKKINSLLVYLKHSSLTGHKFKDLN